MRKFERFDRMGIEIHFTIKSYDVAVMLNKILICEFDPKTGKIFSFNHETIFKLVCEETKKI